MPRGKRASGFPSGKRDGPDHDIHMVQSGELLPSIPDVIVVGWIVASNTALVAMVPSSGAAPGMVSRLDRTARDDSPGCSVRVECRRRVALTPWATLVRGPAPT